jgi:hypothetical protein
MVVYITFIHKNTVGGTLGLVIVTPLLIQSIAPKPSISSPTVLNESTYSDHVIFLSQLQYQVAMKINLVITGNRS